MKHINSRRRISLFQPFRAFIMGFALLLLTIFTLFQNGGRFVKADADTGNLKLSPSLFTGRLGLYLWDGRLASDYGYFTTFEPPPAKDSDNKPETALVTKTWDGGGVTNSWSEAANWSGDTVPLAADSVVFDATSVKNGGVFDVALMPNTQMYVGGAFTSFNGAANTVRIARLNSNGTVDPSFNSGTGFNSTVSTLSFEQPDKVLAGGVFTSYNGTTVNQLTLLNGDGTRDVSFTAQLNAGAVNDVERLFKQPDGKTMVGGRFTGIGGVLRNSIARLEATAATSTLGNYPARSILLSANTIVTPDAAPTGAVSISVATSTNFKGKLEGNPTTGVVRVTDAYPAGIYTVAVRAYDSVGASVTKTFTLTVTTPATCNPVSFASSVNFAVSNVPQSTAIGDFNGDGSQDIVTANGGASNVSILLGNGSGSFGSATNFAV